MTFQPPPGLSPTSGSGFMSPSASGLSSPSSRSKQSSLPAEMPSGSQIQPSGVVELNLIVDDLEIPFQAVKDCNRFLKALYPGWSSPEFVGGVNLPNEVGSCYSLERNEKKHVGEYDSNGKTVTIKKKMSVKVKQIVSEPKYKVISYEVHCKNDSDIFMEPFPTTTYIIIQLVPQAYEAGKYKFTITFDGGPQDVETTYCCFCFPNPDSREAQEASRELRPMIYKQATSVLEYIRDFDPNSIISRQVRQIGSPNVKMLEKRGPSMINIGSPPAKIAHSAPGTYNGDEEDSSKLSARSRRGGGYTSVASGGPTAADEIKKLYDLLNMGALTKREFEMEKAKILELNGGGSSSKIELDAHIF